MPDDEHPMSSASWMDGGPIPDEIEAAIGPAPPPADPAARVVGMDGKPVQPDPVRAVPLPDRPISAIPPRPWAYGTFLLFGQAAALGAVDGGGKGAIATGMSLAFITGQPILGERVWQPGPVTILTYEDDMTEWERRIAAACLFYRLDYEDVRGQIFFLTTTSRRIRIAALREGRTVFPDGDEIVAATKQYGSRLLIIDPFNHVHDMQDGNSNALIAQVAGEITRICRETTVAGLVLHHLRKGSNGAADDLMGATSLRATFRSTRILQRMDPETAKKLKVENGWRYTRIAGTKENYAPPPDKSRWYKLESQELGNPTPLYDSGDNVAVANLWSPPSPFEGLSWAAILAVLDAVASGLPKGELYSPTRQSKRWAGALLTALGRTPDQAAGIIAVWCVDGVLFEETYESAASKRETVGLKVDPAKLGEMRQTANQAEGSPLDE